MSDPSLWFGQLASLLGAMPKTKLIPLAWSLPIFSSFFECSPTIEIPTCPEDKSAQIIASTFRKSLPKPLCFVLASGLFCSRAEGCMGLLRPYARLSPTMLSPLLMVHPHMDLANTNCLPGLLPIASLCGALPAG